MQLTAKSKNVGSITIVELPGVLLSFETYVVLSMSTLPRASQQVAGRDTI